MRKAGKVRDERLAAEELVRRYDKGGKVGLERREFLRMDAEAYRDFQHAASSFSLRDDDSLRRACQPVGRGSDGGARLAPAPARYRAAPRSTPPSAPRAAPRSRSDCASP